MVNICWLRDGFFDCQHYISMYVDTVFDPYANTSEWDGCLKHALRASLTEEGHVLRPSHKQYKNTIGKTFGL
jgi:hypothetical protein